MAESWDIDGNVDMMCFFNEKYRIGGIFLSSILLAVCLIINYSISFIPYILLLGFVFNGRNLTAPIIYLLIPWSFMLVMQFSSTVSYTQKNNSIIPILYLLLCLFSISLGYYLGGIIRLSKRIISQTVPERDGRKVKTINNLISVMCFLSIVGSILYIFDLLFMSGINFTSFATMRETFTAKETTLMSQIGNILAWMCLISVPCLFFLYPNRFQKLLYLSSLALYILQNILAAGRQIVFSIAIMFCVCYAVKKYFYSSKNVKDKISLKEITKYKKIIILLAAVAIIYMMFVATSRNDGNISNTKIGVLEYYFGCSFCPWLSYIFSLLPSGISDGIAEALVYFTHQISEFTVFWDIKKVGPFWGLYSMPFLDRRLEFLKLSDFDMNDKMNYVRSFMDSKGVMPVGWRTAFSYYIFDYGIYGTLLFCILLGFFARKIYRRFCRERSFFSIVALIQICTYFFYTIMMPATCETGLFFMLFFSFIMLAVERFFPKLHLIIR